MKFTNVIGGFWQDRQSLNLNVSIPSIVNTFEDTGRIRALSKELNENEKVVYNLLSDVKVILSEIKEKSALSNKAWDKSTKSLRKLGLISVEKKDDNLYIFRLK